MQGKAKLSKESKELVGVSKGVERGSMRGDELMCNARMCFYANTVSPKIKIYEN